LLKVALKTPKPNPQQRAQGESFFVLVNKMYEDMHDWLLLKCATLLNKSLQ